MPTPSLKNILATKIQTRLPAAREWLIGCARGMKAPFYCSIDLRDAGFKIAPVDSNLYPAGFNNICEVDRKTASGVFRNEIECLAPRAERVLIIPENHTQNQYYAENLYYLSEILRDGGYDVRIGWYTTDGFDGKPMEDIHLKSISGHELTAIPLSLQNGKLQARDFTPDIVVLNNDFSSGYPKFLDSVAQPIFPSHRLGWHTRSKGRHFEHYNRLATEFAKLIDVDPWLITVRSEIVDAVNFNEDGGIDRVAEAAARVLDSTRTAYKERGIKKDAFAFIKNDAGTYGMGIMVVRDAEELRTLNRREKNKMSVGKNGLPIQSVLVQEGIPTTARLKQAAAEPVIYLAGSELIGGFLRANQERSDEDNLNSRGMVFKTLCMSELKHMKTLNVESEPTEDDTEEPVLELVYGTIARLSALAAGEEETASSRSAAKDSKELR